MNAYSYLKRKEGNKYLGRSTRRKPLPKHAPQVRKAKKVRTVCKDGPWKGRALWLTTGETLWVRVGGRVLRYVQGRVQYRDSACYALHMRKERGDT